MTSKTRLIIITLTVCIAYQLPFGFEADTLNNPQDVVEDFIVTTFESKNATLTEYQVSMVWSSIITAFSVGQLFGCVCAAYFAEKLGRRNTLLYMCNSLTLVYTSIFVMTKYVGIPVLLGLGRFIAGFRIGISTTVAAAYIAESVPPEYRSVAGTSLDFSQSLGTVLCYILSLHAILGNHNYWPLLLSSGIVFSIVGVIAGPWFKESPKHLLLTKTDPAGAYESARFFYGSHHSIGHLIGRLLSDESGDGKGRVNWREVKDNFRILVVSACIGALPSVTGDYAVGSYSTPMLQRVRMPYQDAEIYSLAMAFAEIVASFLGFAVVHFLRRRTAIFASGLFIAAGNVVITIFMVMSENHPDMSVFMHVSGVLLVIFTGSNSLAPTALLNIIPAEIVPHHLRAFSCTVAMTSMSLAFIFTQAMVWPVFVAIGGYVFLVFTFMTLALLLVLWFWLPETNPNIVRSDTESTLMTPTESKIAISNSQIPRSRMSSSSMETADLALI